MVMAWRLRRYRRGTNGSNISSFEFSAMMQQQHLSSTLVYLLESLSILCVPSWLRFWFSDQRDQCLSAVRFCLSDHGDHARCRRSRLFFRLRDPSCSLWLKVLVLVLPFTFGTFGNF